MSTMISQNDVTLNPSTTTTTTTKNINTTTTATTNTTTEVPTSDYPPPHPHHHHSNKSNSTTVNLHNGKTSNGFSSATKKRKKLFDETIIDGFAIIAFKTWEDLQDELNGKDSTVNINNNNINQNNTSINNSNNNNNTANINTKLTNSNAGSNNNKSINTNNGTDNTADKKSNSKSKQKSSSTSTNTTSTNTSGNLDTNFLSNNTNSNSSSTSPNYKDVIGKIKKEKSAKKSSDHSQANPKDKRNKTSSERTDLKKALEAKELAEKRLAIVQAKLKQEKMKNLNHIVNNATPIVPEQYNSPEPSPHIVKEEIHTRTVNRELLLDPSASTKSVPYPPYQMSSHSHRTESIIHQTMQIHNPPSSPLQTQHLHHPPQVQHQKQPSHLHHHNQSQNPSQPVPQPQAQSNLHAPPPHNVLPHQTQQSTTPIAPPPPPQVQHNFHQQYPRQSTIPAPQTHPHLHPPAPNIHPYASQQQTSALMSPLGLAPLPSPYNCPTSIYITESVSRQTSVIPQPALGAALELPTISPPGSRFGQPNVLHSMSQYTPPALHHPMYYPMLPTERSFMELARNFTGPNHVVYPNLMNSFPTPSPSVTANSHNFVRWPRVPLDHHRAVSRYNTLYQNAAAAAAAAAPTRAYANFTSTRPPSFPAGLFPPPF